MWADIGDDEPVSQILRISATDSPRNAMRMIEVAKKDIRYVQFWIKCHEHEHSLNSGSSGDGNGCKGMPFIDFSRFVGSSQFKLYKMESRILQ